MLTGYSVRHYISLAVVDVTQLIQYQLFAIKWFVALMLVNMAYLLDKWQKVVDVPKWILENQQRILLIFHTGVLEQLFGKTVTSVITLVKQETWDSDEIWINQKRISQKMIQENLVSLGVIHNDEITNSRDDIMNTDLINLETLLHRIRTDQNGELIKLKDYQQFRVILRDSLGYNIWFEK